MAFKISLLADNKLADNRKYRSTLPAEILFTTTNVNIGNFSNLNLFCDNTVEIGCGSFTVPPIVEPIPALSIAIQSTHIKIEYDGYIIIGAITDWNYVNDNNINFTYVVDAYMSAMLSGLIDKAEGLCERVNMDTGTAFFANDQNEPFSPSDYSYADGDITKDFNEQIHSFESILPGNKGISTTGTVFILTVSQALAQYVGATTPFTTPTTPTAVLKDIANFRFGGADTFAHMGGVYRGMPLKFATAAAVTTFIKAILSGCGFRTTMPSTGYSTMQSVVRRMVAVTGDDNGAQGFFTHKNWNNDTYEAIRFISGNDIYNLYCIPDVFAKNEPNYKTAIVQAEGFPNINTAFHWGGEGNFAGKLLGYPYIYYKMVTANGDSIQIIPQVHYSKTAAHTPDFKVSLDLRFVGGDTPRLMGRIIPAGSESIENGQDSYINQSVCEWFTIRNYPSVTLSYNVTMNQQAQRDLTSYKKIAQKYNNAVAMNRLTSPISQGYKDSVANNATGKVNDNMGIYNTLGYVGGAVIGGIQGAAANALGIKNGSALGDTLKQELMNDYAMSQAENFLSPESGSVMGNDFLSQYGVPAVSCYWQGASDAELFAFARYMEEFGSTCNGRVNPIDDSHDILGATANIIKFNGQTFYKFTHISIDGKMPHKWRQNIKALFESGCYLIG